MIHKPVLQKEVLEYLKPEPNKNFIDATIGGGGHTAAILERIKPNGKVLGIEIDSDLYKKLRIKKHDRLILINDSYSNLKRIIRKYKLEPVNGILLDLGMSSWHLEESGRGFTFLKDEPLDMRYSLDNNLTAGEIINKYSQEEIERILKEYGQERFAGRITRKIVLERPIKTTFQLKEIIKRSKVYSFSRIFQALRIAVNDELNNLKKVLPQAIEILAPKGKIVVISFHSLEDRIVKRFFKEEKGIKIITKKPVTASEIEIKTNPRSRSAKLRAATKQ